MSSLSIIGGSIAGCLSALAFRNTGFEVSVFERSTASLTDRGAAVVIPQELFSRLKDLDFVAAGHAPLVAEHGVRQGMVHGRDAEGDRFVNYSFRHGAYR